MIRQKVLKFLNKDQFIKKDMNKIGYMKEINHIIGIKNLKYINVNMSIIKENRIYVIYAKTKHEEWMQNIFYLYNQNNKKLYKLRSKQLIMFFMMNDVIIYEDIRKMCNNIDIIFCESKIIKLIGKIPCFIYSKSIKKSEFYIKTPNFYYIPDGYLLDSKRLKSIKERSNRGLNFYNKNNKLFWAGSPQNHFNNIRYNILDMQVKNNNNKFIDSYYGYKTIEDALKYKFIVSLEGWSSSWDRTVWVSNSDSILFKDSNSNHKCFYDIFFKPYEHFIPYKKELNNIILEYKKINQNINFLYNIRKNSNLIHNKMFSRNIIVNSFFSSIIGYSNNFNENILVNSISSDIECIL